MKQQSKKHFKRPKGRKGAWFVKLRGSYLPCSWQGWLLYIPYILFLAYIIFPYALWPLMCTATDPCISITSQWALVLTNLVEVGLAVWLMTVIAKKKS